MNDSLRFNCASCKRLLEVKQEHHGKRIRCPGCKAVFTVMLPGLVVPPPIIDSSGSNSGTDAPPPPPLSTAQNETEPPKKPKGVALQRIPSIADALAYLQEPKKPKGTISQRILIFMVAASVLLPIALLGVLVLYELTIKSRAYGMVTYYNGSWGEASAHYARVIVSGVCCVGFPYVFVMLILITAYFAARSMER